MFIFKSNIVIINVLLLKNKQISKLFRDLWYFMSLNIDKHLIFDYRSN